MSLAQVLVVTSFGVKRAPLPSIWQSHFLAMVLEAKVGSVIRRIWTILTRAFGKLPALPFPALVFV